MRLQWLSIHHRRRTGSSLSSVCARHLSAGLASATCCLMMLVALDANLSLLEHQKERAELSTFRLLTEPPPAPRPQPRRAEAPRSEVPRPLHSGEPPINLKGDPATAPLPAHPGTAAPVPVPTANMPPATDPDVPPPQTHDDRKQMEIAAYEQLVWARIASRKPAGVHLTGVALVRFAIGDGGMLLAVELAATSGNTALDRLALRTVRNAAPFPAPPTDVERDQRVFTIAFSFH